MSGETGLQPIAVETQMLPVEQAANPNQILALAVSRDADPALIEKMMELQERWEANEAKKAYVKAMAAFKAEAPSTICKDGEVDFSTSKGRTHYRHATLDGVMSKVNPVLSKHGLSVSWDTVQDNGGVTVTCNVTHVQGHTESVSLSGQPDNSGNKNHIQQVGSTVTYLQRYTVLSALGLATGMQDDDGRAAEVPAGLQDVRAWMQDRKAESDNDALRAMMTFMVDIGVNPKRWEQCGDDNIAKLAEWVQAYTPAEPEPKPDDSGMPTGDALDAEIAALLDKVPNPDDKKMVADCGIGGDWQDAPEAMKQKLLNRLIDWSNA